MRVAKLLYTHGTNIGMNDLMKNVSRVVDNYLNIHCTLNEAQTQLEQGLLLWPGVPLRPDAA